MVKNILDLEAANIGVKNLSPTQTQAGYENMPSDLDISLGLCIYWVIAIHIVKSRQLVITMVKYAFAVAASILGVKNFYPHKSKPLGIPTFPVTFS